MSATFHYMFIRLNITCQVVSVAPLQIAELIILLLDNLSLKRVDMVQIKIKLDVSEGTHAYYRLQEQWENEGGAVAIKSEEDLVPNRNIPFVPGDTFRVLNTSLDLVNENFYYIAEIEIIPIKVLDELTTHHTGKSRP